MFQWTNLATPQSGPIKAWEQKVNDFDLDPVIQLVEDSGASSVIWSITWGQRYYNTHFDSTKVEGILSAPFREISQAARVGNNDRVLCYNSWLLPRLTEYQDYFAGEGQSPNASTLDDGVFIAGGQKGMMGFGCFPLERRWGHIDEDKLIEKPRYTEGALVKHIKRAKANRYPIAYNLEMYEDGSVSPLSAELLKAVRQKLEAFK